ncbi:hypothetical protein LY01_02191 [Nonlabens xylanidelens]|uniref:DUF998 domain-containing protein n=1 Tax=Nonlabens xylanidelens TaxID=191564 RepID=A0A2S6IIC6_9FLAO|nr:DUF6796 family protein [Nonlabens xylanidelens]PPK93969.1 hypothetical protein LY01_02191 [Nonlabens xylanidelens]PQJ22125.1 hypothetical protein BST94_00675 [Nonlabens xylanidelens]
MTTKTAQILGFLGILASILVGAGEYLLHYSPQIMGESENYNFFSYVPLSNLSLGHTLAMIGLPFYFAGYFHIYYMLKTGNKLLAQLVLATGFIAFAIGGVWIGSRASIGNIVHLQDSINPTDYKNLIDHYTAHMEVLVQVLRIVIALLSILFIIAILKGSTQYKKWMAILNPITILIALVLIGFALPSIGQHIIPILMNVTHFILFTISLIQLYKNNRHV